MGGLFMVMIQKNLEWHNLPEVKIGDYGEQLVRNILERHGFKVYQAITEGAHLIDFIVENNKKLIFAVEVKTKPMMIKYRETGFNYKHYEHYRDFSLRAHMPVLIVFVDSSKGKIYGNFLSVLDEPRIQDGIKYPKTMPAKFYKTGDLIRYYPEDAMLFIAKLSDSDCQNLQRSRTAHY